MPRPRKLAVSLACVALVLAAGEVCARLVLGERFGAGVLTDLPMNVCVVPDAELGWAGRPDMDAWCVGPSFAIPAFEYRVRTGSDGFRSADPGDGDLPLVLVLGDSIAWGWGVRQDETFAARLRATFAGRARVQCLGVPGYATDQQLLLLERVAEDKRPDLVLLSYALNDAEGNGATEQYGLPKPALARRGGDFELVNYPVAASWPDDWDPSASSWRTRLRAHSALLQLVRPLRFTRSRTAPEALTGADHEQLIEYARNLECDTYSAAEAHHLAGEVGNPDSVTFELLRRIKSVCDAAGAELIAFSVPHHHDQFLLVPRLVPSTTAAAALRGEGRFRTRLSDQLARAAAALGFDAVDVDHELLELSQVERVNLNAGDGHINAEGHRIVAEALSRVVAERLAR
ncbi:MAG: SGNH/GDSL hydrolase family protein [Planctomycetota bacterium]